MMPRSKPLHWKEPTCRDGVLLSDNHIALLQGLLDCPGGTVRSVRDWVAVAMPHLERLQGSVSYSCFIKTTRTVHPLWVSRRREGSRIVCTITTRGRGIINGSVPARVRGVGPYRGIAELQRARRRSY